MDRNGQLDVFRAQTKNVRQLETAWAHCQRSINRELASDNFVSAKVHSRLLALVFCAWSEANFSKLIHTPHGFDLDEIHQIKTKAERDIVRAWKKCLELGLRRVNKPQKSSYLPNIRQSVERIIDAYVQVPSLLRNKIAHGQWVVALNRENDAVNVDLTNQMDSIDVVELCIWRDAYKGLSNIIEALIESPNRAFHRDYWVEIVNLQEHLRRTETWTLEDKLKKLRTKAAYRNKLSKSNTR